MADDGQGGGKQNSRGPPNEPPVGAEGGLPGPRSPDRSPQDSNLQQYPEDNVIKDIPAPGSPSQEPRDSHQDAPLDFSLPRPPQAHSPGPGAHRSYERPPPRGMLQDPEVHCNGGIKLEPVSSDDDDVDQEYHHYGSSKGSGRGAGVGYHGYRPTAPPHDQGDRDDPPHGRGSAFPGLMPHSSSSRGAEDKGGAGGAMSAPGVSGGGSSSALEAALARTSSTEEVLEQYKQYIVALQEHLESQGSPPGASSGSSSSSSVSSQGHRGGPDLFPAPTPSHTPPSRPYAPLTTSPHSPHSLPPSSSSHTNSAGPSPSRKRGRSLPDSLKDDAYWDRRRKNNEAAKRSRDSRRAKEDQIAIRAAFLEQENLKLRVEVTALKNETAKLRCMLYNS